MLHWCNISKVETKAITNQDDCLQHTSNDEKTRSPSLSIVDDTTGSTYHLIYTR